MPAHAKGPLALIPTLCFRRGRDRRQGPLRVSMEVMGDPIRCAVCGARVISVSCLPLGRNWRRTIEGVSTQRNSQSSLWVTGAISRTPAGRAAAPRRWAADPGRSDVQDAGHHRPAGAQRVHRYGAEHGEPPPEIRRVGPYPRQLLRLWRSWSMWRRSRARSLASDFKGWPCTYVVAPSP